LYDGTWFPINLTERKYIMTTIASRGTSTIALVRSGILAGFAATCVASVIMLMNNAIGKIPDLHIPQTLSVMLGEPDHIMVGGITFFITGTFLFGIIYPLIAPRLPVRSNPVKGLLFGVAIWLAMMLLVMPLAGAGFFAVNRSAIAPAAVLLLTLVYGMVLAAVYAWDRAGGEPLAKRSGGKPRGHNHSVS
jgi:hypothetical protein